MGIFDGDMCFVNPLQITSSAQWKPRVYMNAVSFQGTDIYLTLNLLEANNRIIIAPLQKWLLQRTL